MTVGAPLRFGLIGLGSRGQALAAAANECAGVVVAVGASSDDATVETGRDTWWGYRSPDEIIAADEIDAVLVAVPPRAAGLDYVRGALERGKAVLWLGQPSGLAELDALLVAGGGRAARLSLPNDLSYLPSTRALREAVAAGHPGPLLSVFSAWRTRLPHGETLLEDLGVPLLDYLRGCLGLGEEIERVHVTAGPLGAPERQAALLLLRCASGLVVTVELADALPAHYEEPDELIIEVLGEDAALRAEPFNQAVTVAGAARRGRFRWHRDASFAMMQDFVAALRDDRVLPGAPATLRPTLALLEELREAAASGEARQVTPVR